MDAPPPPPVAEVVIVRPLRLPAAAGDRVFSIVSLPASAIQAAPRLDTALEAAPGVSLFRRNSSLSANPTTQGVSLRSIAGSGASRALVTLDGQPLNDPFGGWVIWSAVPRFEVSGADIVRGAGAGPYGAGALTGVVALSTPPPSQPALAGEASYGDGKDFQGAATASGPIGPLAGELSAAGESAKGYVPVRQGRGPIDTPLGLHDWSVSGRLAGDIGPGAAGVRLAAWQENRGAGVVGAASVASGQSLSVTYAVAPQPGALGYRIQGWVMRTGFAYATASANTARTVATPANDQYATPATGFGVNGAVRALSGPWSVEVGGDVRGADGQSEELFKYAVGAFTRRRVAGGRSLEGGVYAEGAREAGGLLLTAGVRVDGWSVSNGHRIETVLATGSTSLAEHPAPTGGAEPTARLGARKTIGPGLDLRAAAYEGFRPASLNELFRPFRVGNDITEANAGLKPERLSGAETGFDAKAGSARLSLTGFANRIDDAVVNATVRQGPFTDPIAGFVPAGGTLFLRRNVDHITAYGLEGEASVQPARWLNVRVAADYTDAEVYGAGPTAGLTGKRPAETAKFTATAGFDVTPVPSLTLSADARYEGTRYDDDLNTRRLAPGGTVDLRADWRAGHGVDLFVAADNLFDAAIQTGRTAANVVSYDAPRRVRVGLAFRR